MPSAAIGVSPMPALRAGGPVEPGEIVAAVVAGVRAGGLIAEDGPCDEEVDSDRRAKGGADERPLDDAAEDPRDGQRNEQPDAGAGAR